MSPDIEHHPWLEITASDVKIMNYRTHFRGMVGRIIASEDVSILMLGTYDDVTLHGKGGLRLQMELWLPVR